MSQLAQVFSYSDQPIRTSVVDDEPWFVAADVCGVLGLANPRSSLAILDDDERGVHTVDTPGGAQQLAVVNEPGLYSLILRSRRPEAKAFKRWVTHDVLPALRRTGRSAPARLPDRRELAIMVIAEADRADRAEAELAVATPKAEAWEHLASGDGDFSVADAAKVLSRNPAIQLGERRLFTVLDGLGWIFRQRADNRWRVYQRAVDSGWLSELPTSHYHPRTGELVIDPPQVRVTAKGLEALQSRLTVGQLALGAAQG